MTRGIYKKKLISVSAHNLYGRALKKHIQHDSNLVRNTVCFNSSNSTKVQYK